ncbi:Tryptophanyl-tRNA synthetase [Candidatus Phytoplasma mali]|uniref:Tryptophan--tRNA ligase n=1 Tax=Phytoplasma mali (strain AT) TaxID=482235 RepID=B3R0B5_PHYMT|nr:tryptophan--tRNA ligase [Candidatus Phytoplasma mali]CAP18279.1 Tryptophanyl-tRNA synthetase [Candidatus Phytoplasma mali]
MLKINKDNSKKILVTGIKPSGDITLGNYLGIIKPLTEILKKNSNLEIYLFIADLHAITIFQKPQILKEQIIKIIKIYLASGLNLKNVNLFVQSDIKEHPYLGYLMETNSYVGEMSRMINYKQTKLVQASKKNPIRTALLTYPALMAADILLYNADYVLVGADQKQHLELTKKIAERFNNLYGNVFKIPTEIKLNYLGNKIKSLLDPTKKMSKSNHDSGCIYILDDASTIHKKIMRSTTDSDNCIFYDINEKPGISNLLNIYGILKNMEIKKIEDYFKKYSYQKLKQKVSASVIKELEKIQKKIDKINDKQIKKILEKGTIKVQKQAHQQLLQVKQKLGLGYIL